MGKSAKLSVAHHILICMIWRLDELLYMDHYDTKIYNALDSVKNSIHSLCICWSQICAKYQWQVLYKQRWLGQRTHNLGAGEGIG